MQKMEFTSAAGYKRKRPGPACRIDEGEGEAMKTEQGLLRISIAVTVLLAGFGILFGILSGSFAIVFDGVYALTDAAMTVLALLVSNLIASSGVGSAGKGRLVKNFTMGFWHLEPMVLGLNGILLTGAAIYALINAIGSIMEGGRPLDFDQAIIYAVVTLTVTIAMAIIGSRANRTIKSDFVALDAKAWMMSAGLTAALLIAFVFGYLIQGSAYEWLSPYIDPVALALVCLVIIPIPAGTIRQALADILLVTPADLKGHVDTVAQAIVEKHGFLSYRAYVARVGRGRQIELFFIVPEDFPAKKLQEWDDIRDEIGIAIGDEGPDRWLTIAFTTDPEWAD
jgi:predicted Co/Zn/Cd cation transporter (cation efflux family)